MDAKSEEVRQRCIEVLLDLGASKEFSQFYADVLQCEYDITYSSYALHKEVRETKRNGSSPLYATIQKLARSFNSWRLVVQELSAKQLANRAMRPDDAPKFSRAQTLKAVCSLETNEVKLSEGDEMIITDASQPNQLKVRNPKGEEGYVPALSCVLPVPDGNSLHAIERLEIQLLTSWTESVARLRPVLHQTLNSASTDILTQWTNSAVRGRSAWQERVSRRMKRIGDIFGRDLHSNGGGVDLNRLHKTLTSLENELTWQKDSGLSKLIETISNIDKTILCYQAFRKQLLLYRKSLKESVRPIRIVNWNPKAFEEHGKSLKYFEVKWTAEEVLTKEESVYLNAKKNQQEKKEKEKEKASELDHLVGGSKREKVSAEEIVSRSHEENKRFFVRSVVDPRRSSDEGGGGEGGGGRLMSIKDAVAEGIVDHQAGLYMNPVTGESKTISAAMAEGLIQVDYATTTKTDEKVESIGLITIRTQIDNHEYRITGAVDTRTSEALDADEARGREAIDEAAGQFVDLATGTRYPLDEAIERGWVFVHYDDSDASAAAAATELETKTYAVSAVVDQAQRKPVPFVEAVRRGLIDRRTGNYVNNVTGDRVFAAEAIRRGFFKSVVVEDPTTLNIDATNRVVVERIERVRKNVLRGVRVISAFSRALKAAAGAGAGADGKTQQAKE